MVLPVSACASRPEAPPTWALRVACAATSFVDMAVLAAKREGSK